MRKRMFSFKSHLLFILALIVIPAFFCLFFYNYYSIRTVNDEVAEAGTNTIRLYQSKMESNLRNLSLTVSEYWANDYSHANMVYQVNELTRHLSGYEIEVKYQSLLATNDFLGGIGIISEKNELKRYYFRERGYSLDEQKVLKAVAEEWLADPDDYARKGWQPVMALEKGMLMRILGYGGGYTILFVDLQEIVLEQWNSRQADEGFLFFTTEEGEMLLTQEKLDAEKLRAVDFEKEYSIVEQVPRYMMVNQYSDMLHARILYLIPYKSNFSYMNRMQGIFLCMSILILLLLPVGYLIISRFYFRPMDDLIRTMEKVRDGKLDERLEGNYRIAEFRKLSQTFDQMITEIQNLKVESWERERQKNRAELQYLQLQLRPHFFLNCLKNLYAMAEIQRYDKMQDMILQISEHMRYFFKDNTSLVPLEEEIAHVENYVSLQKTSMGQDVILDLYVEEELRHCHIPVLLIQTFVENSFKYGRRENQPLRISIQIVGLLMEEESLIDIVIRDNGNGFAPEILKQLNEDRPERCTERHIGITNIRQRLFLIYGEDAVMECMNLEEGAQSELILPVRPREQHRKEETDEHPDC